MSYIDNLVNHIESINTRLPTPTKGSIFVCVYHGGNFPSEYIIPSQWTVTSLKAEIEKVFRVSLNGATYTFREHDDVGEDILHSVVTAMIDGAQVEELMIKV